MHQPIKTMAHPLGHRLESHTKSQINRRFPRFSVRSALPLATIGTQESKKYVSWFVLCARALGFAAFHRRDERMNEKMRLSHIS